MGQNEKIRIASFEVSSGRVDPGGRLTIRVAFTGPGNIGLRQTVGAEGVIPGWDAHSAGFAFMPGNDFAEEKNLKNPTHFHRDNGKLDSDDRRGHWQCELDTSGWPEATYTFGIMVCNRPYLGPFEGDMKMFQLVVGTPLPLEADAGDLEGLVVSVNDEILDGRNPEAPIRPGRPNAMTVTTTPEHGANLDYVLELTRLLPGERSDPDPLAVQTRRLSAAAAEAVFDLGLFAVPADFDFTAGRLRHRATRFVLTVKAVGGRLKGRVAFGHTIGSTARRDVLRAGASDWLYHLGFRGGGPKALDPPVLLSLDPEVLTDPGEVTALLRLREDLDSSADAEAPPISGMLTATTDARAQPWIAEVTASRQQTRVPLPADLVAASASTPLSLSFSPRMPGSADNAGPLLTYRRRVPEPGTVQLSPWTPWTLDQDTGRTEIDIADMTRAESEGWLELPEDAGWEIRGQGADSALIQTTGDWEAPPVRLRLPTATGWYAVFAEAERGWTMVRIGDGLVRGVRLGPTFVEAAEMTGRDIRVYPVDLPEAGLRRLRLTPVTAASVESFRHTVQQPPRILRGVADWCDYFTPPPVHHSGGGRLAEDQLELLVAGHGELGMRSIAWSIGRSWVEYHSDLPRTSRFPCAPLSSIDEIYQRRYRGRTVMINEYRPLESVLEYGQRHDVDILPWLAMQRHYGNAYGGIFSSDWFRSNPRWRRVSKNGSVSSSTVCYHFEEVRQERCNIFAEVAGKGVSAVVVGCCRQVPMLLYHPEMVADFQALHGFDPRQIDATDEQAYRTWITWRAARFTETLRDLRQILKKTAGAGEKNTRIVVRIPSVGLFYNLAQGLDVRAWLQEKLVDELQIEPLEDCNGNAGDHDLRPYLRLADAAGIPVIGAVNGNTWRNVTAILKRSLGLLEAGVAGIEIYESNNFAICSDRRWLIPLLGHPDALRKWLQESNLDAVYPVWSRSAASGFDNHSFGGGGWSVHGNGGLSL